MPALALYPQVCGTLGVASVQCGSDKDGFVKEWKGQCTGSQPLAHGRGLLTGAGAVSALPLRVPLLPVVCGVHHTSDLQSGPAAHVTSSRLFGAQMEANPHAHLSCEPRADDCFTLGCRRWCGERV